MALTLPTSSQGIHQGDLVIRRAITFGLDDIRKNPWICDYVFRNQVEDPLPQQDDPVGGQADVDRARDFLLNTNIEVYHSVRPDDPKFPCVTIALGASNEKDNTLADKDAAVDEPASVPDPSGVLAWPALTTPFDVVGYDPKKGTVTVPPTVAPQVTVHAGMYLVARSGRAYPVVQPLTDTTFTVAAGIQEDFTQAVIKPAQPAQSALLESALFSESYVVGCHVNQSPVHLVWLHSFVVYCLLRYRQRFLEARGLMNSSIQSSDFTKNPHFPDAERVYSRYVTVTGEVLQYWVKDVVGRVQSVDTSGITATQPQINLEAMALAFNPQFPR